LSEISSAHGRLAVLREVLEGTNGVFPKPYSDFECPAKKWAHMKQNSLLLEFLPIAFLYLGCGTPSSSFAPIDCATLSTASLTHYDEISQRFLDQRTAQPLDNTEGGVVWNTRYYLESLLIAYSATGNPKYIKAFLDTGTWVMNMTQTLPYVDAYDPSA